MNKKLRPLQITMLLGGAVAAMPAFASLIVLDAIPNAALSIDGFGSTANSGNLQSDTPTGATILKAYLYASSVWSGPTSGATLNGTALSVASGAVLAPNANPATTVRWDVTSIVKPMIEGTWGLQNHSILESGDNDGETLVIVYRTPSTTGTAIIMDGELATTGDSTTLSLASPYATGNLFMSLASSYSYNGDSTTNTTGQVTIVDVSTSTNPGNRRLTSCAGGNDDGAFAAANGALMTVGGVGDNAANPSPTCAGGAGDDELYNLAMGNSANANPFLTVGDTYITFNTNNPTSDDNVFLLAFTGDIKIKQINDVPVDPNPIPEPASLALMGLGLAGLGFARRKKN